jgi:large subunit ribosomal protein L25
MEKFKLKVEARHAGKKPNQLRRDGKIPATLYGPGEPSTSYQVDAKEFSRLPAAAYSHILELGADKGGINAIIRHVQRDHVSHQVLNIELYKVAANRKLTVSVPLKIVGVSEAIQQGGQLVTNYSEAEVECLPADIPDNIEVDISSIHEVDHGIHFNELKISDKIKILNPPDEVVVKVVAPRTVTEEKEAAPAAAEAAAAPAAAAPAAS